ncbi:MAG TPA: hypothetical protein VMU33_16675 [Burkholderiaceae bacterium]|nr:hypothetical protein [Burkholderiaceae bacterium]
MFKFAFAAGVVAEWLLGGNVETPQQFAHCALRALMATILAWIVLEALRAVYRTVMSYDDHTAHGSRG